MGSRKVCKSIVLIITILIISTVSFADDNWKNYLNGIEIQKIGESLKKVVSPYQNTVDNKNNGKKPVTWGDFIRKMTVYTGEEENSLADLLSINYKLMTPLVMTKDEIAINLVTLLNLTNQDIMNTRSINTFNATIASISPQRNYLLNNELNMLFEDLDSYIISGGILRGIKKGKLVNLLPNDLGVFDIVKGNDVTRVTLPLNIQYPWEMKNSLYNITIENGKVIALESEAELLYDVVRNSSTGLKIDEKEISRGNKMVKSGDYVEYIEQDDKITVLTNYGRPKSYVVKEVGLKNLTTFEGKTFDINVNYVTDKGIIAKMQDIKPYTLISLLEGNKAVISENSKSSDLNFVGNTLLIDGVMFNDRDILITDGTTVRTVSDWKSKSWVNKGDVISDLNGVPKVIKIDKIENPVVVTSVSQTEISALSNENKTFKLSPYLKQQVYLDEMCTLIVIDNEVVDIERPLIEYDTLDIINKNRINLRGKSYNIEDNTPVVIVDEGIFEIQQNKVSQTEESPQQEEKEQPKKPVINIRQDNYTDTSYITLTYGQLVDKYPQYVGRGSLNIEALVSNGQAILLKVKVNPVLGLNSKNHLDKSDVYTLNDCKRVGNTNIVVLSTPNSSAVLTYNNHIDPNMIGKEVQVIFNVDGTIRSIY